MFYNFILRISSYKYPLNLHASQMYKLLDRYSTFIYTFNTIFIKEYENKRGNILIHATSLATNKCPFQQIIWLIYVTLFFLSAQLKYIGSYPQFGSFAFQYIYNIFKHIQLLLKLITHQGHLSFDLL